MITYDQCLLTLLVDSSKTNKDDLKQKIMIILDRHGPRIKIDIKETNFNILELSIEGSLDDIDACHFKLSRSNELYKALIILEDDPGKDIRSRAYPILSKIELQLRTFINRSIIEIFGFDWWHMAPEKTKNRVMNIEEKNNVIHDKIEFTNFDDLVTMVTHCYQEWDDYRPMSAKDIKDIISDCTSMTEFKEKIDKKLCKISLWDDVFSKYFNNNINDWKKLESYLLKYGMPIRNKVMHHRPMYIWELEKLSEIDTQIDTILGSKVELKEEDRIEANKIGRDIIIRYNDINNMRGTFQFMAQSMKKAMEQYDQMKNGIMTTLQPMKQAVEQFKEMENNIQTIITSPGYNELKETIETIKKSEHIFKIPGK